MRYVKVRLVVVAFEGYEMKKVCDVERCAEAGAGAYQIRKSRFDLASNFGEDGRQAGRRCVRHPGLASERRWTQPEVKFLLAVSRTSPPHAARRAAQRAGRRRARNMSGITLDDNFCTYNVKTELASAGPGRAKADMVRRADRGISIYKRGLSQSVTAPCFGHSFS